MNNRLARITLSFVGALQLAACTSAGGGGKPPAASGIGAEETASHQTRGAKTEPARHHDVSPPLYLIAPARRVAVKVEHKVKPIPRPQASQHPTKPVQDGALQKNAPTRFAMTAPSSSIDGIGNGFNGPQGTFGVGGVPPDTNGDVGPDHYVQTVNGDFVIWSKTGTVLYGPVPLNTLWGNFGGGCETNNDGDPVVLYDPMADRWVISQFVVLTQPYLECVAVSQTSDPTGAYSRYSFEYTDFPDYPKMGVWPDAYYATFNMWSDGGTTFKNGKVCAYDRSPMLAGQAATQQCFDTTLAGVLPADVDGHTWPAAGTPNYLVALGAAANELAFFKFHVDWGTPANSTLTGPTTLKTAAFTEACSGSACIPQPGTTEQLDSLGDRLMYRLAYRNFGTHESLTANHSVSAGNSTGIRWYELRVNNGTPAIFQQGTYAPDASFRWLGSVAQNQEGDIALGFSVSSDTLHPQVHYTGRFAGDPAGQMAQGEGTILDGAGSQLSIARWGDYSMMSVDPTDDRTFWFTSEYLPAPDGSYNWKTRIASFTMSPTSGADGTVLVRRSSGRLFSPNEDWTHGAYFGSRGTFFADVTGDGRADAIVVNDETVVVRRSDGNQFRPNEDWTHGAYFGSRGTSFADVDGDGKADAIVVNDDTVVVRRSDGSQFKANEDWTHGAYFGSRGTFFADVNGDGKADAIVVNDNTVVVRLSTGSEFGPPTDWTHGAYFGSRGTSFADVDGDGKADAIAVNDNGIFVRLSDGSQFKAAEDWTHRAYYGPKGVFFADVDGDKRADAIVDDLCPRRFFTKQYEFAGNKWCSNCDDFRTYPDDALRACTDGFHKDADKANLMCFVDEVDNNCGDHNCFAEVAGWKVPSDPHNCQCVIRFHTDANLVHGLHVNIRIDEINDKCLPPPPPPPPACGPDTCPNGCCDADGICRSGKTNASCGGPNGDACDICDPNPGGDRTKCVKRRCKRF